MKVGYVRVSSVDQNPDRQLEGVEVDRIFLDKASGKDTERPQLRMLMDFAREGDQIFVHSLDRLARNLRDLKNVVDHFISKKVRINFIKESLFFEGSGSPMATLMLNIMGSFAEFELSLIKERQKEGIALAKKRGVYEGRKRAITPEQMEEAKKRVALGVTKAKIARDLKVSYETLRQYLKGNRPPKEQEEQK